MAHPTAQLQLPAHTPSLNGFPNPPHTTVTSFRHPNATAQAGVSTVYPEEARCGQGDASGLDAAFRTSATVMSTMPPASLPDLARCHSWSYLARIRELAQCCTPAVPYVSIDADTMVSAGS